MTKSPYSLQPYTIFFDVEGEFNTGYISVEEGSELLDITMTMKEDVDYYEAWCLVTIGLPRTKRYFKFVGPGWNINRDKMRFITSVDGPEKKWMVFEDFSKKIEIASKNMDIDRFAIRDIQIEELNQKLENARSLNMAQVEDIEKLTEKLEYSEKNFGYLLFKAARRVDPKCAGKDEEYILKNFDVWAKWDGFQVTDQQLYATICLANSRAGGIGDWEILGILGFKQCKNCRGSQQIVDMTTGKMIVCPDCRGLGFTREDDNA